MAYRLHIAFPADQITPGLSAHVDAFVATQAATTLGADWTVRKTQYDRRGHLDAKQFVSAVLAQPGPVLLVRPIQRDALGEVTGRLESRQLVVPAEVYDAATLLGAIQDLKAHHDRGEPLVPLKRAVGLMIVRKLDRERMWGGNAKGFMWKDWIPKGRGVAEEYQPHIGDLLFLLKQHDVLISKISNSKPKFALNPDRRSEIGNVLRDRRFSAELERVFARDGATLTVRVLDCLDEYDPE